MDFLYPSFHYSHTSKCNVESRMEEAAVPWSRIAAFVRQHTHDVRNGLNSLDLETSFLQELVTDNEAAASADRVRKQVRGLAQQLRTLSMMVQEPSPLAAKTPAKALLKIWREKQAAMTGAPEVRWQDQLADEEVDVDVEIMATVFHELLANAKAFSPGEVLEISARSHGGRVIFELREPKKAAVDTRNWGQPFSTPRHDHYGLGLWSARRLLKSCGAELTQEYVPTEACLMTQIVLPMM
jgi:K+-sensing histidine kinase KdpD